MWICSTDLSVSFCGCESEAETLLHLKLFPATPKYPPGIYILLAGLAESPDVGCQVSAQSFETVHSFLPDAFLMKVKDMHRHYGVIPIATCFNLLDYFRKWSNPCVQLLLIAVPVSRSLFIISLL